MSEFSADIGAPFVEAKISPPSIRRDMIDRRRITQILQDGADTRVKVFDAPAGYGKSTAIRSWCATQDAGLMWVTLDADDDDPVRLWTYIATAAERIRPGLARPVLQRLEIQGAPIGHAVDELMTILGRSRKPAILVLDDLHTLTNPDSLATIDRAMRHMPENLRLVMGTRMDPSLSLARWRAGQQVTELRARDLAFTVTEARDLLVGRFGLDLPSDQVAALVERTQGWPAMLVLSGIWLRGVDDPASAVSRFGAEQRFVADYLSAEVLAGLDEEQSAFLRGVAVLGDFTPALCDAALQRTGSREVIVGLVREGHFVSRLEGGDLFRIHPLFGEYALLELDAAEPGAAQEIHLRAARWLAPHQPLEALQHASAAGEHALVAELLAEHHLALIRTGAWRTFLRWARTLPDDVLMAFPEVAGAAAIGSLIEGFGALERRRYLHLLDETIAAGQVPADGYVAVMVKVARVLGLDQGVANGVELGYRAVELARDGMDPLALGALAGYGRAMLLGGDLDGAHDAALQVRGAGDLTRQVPAHVHALVTLTLVEVALGRLGAAQGHLGETKDLVGQISAGRSWLGGNVELASGALLLAQGHAAEAHRRLAAAERLLRDEVPTIHHTWSLLLLARADAQRWRLDEATQLSDRARDTLDELPDAGILPGLLAEVEQEISSARERATDGAVVVALSDAELTVLRLMTEDLSIREMGARLYVSENTVRTHRRAVYRKLGVHSRVEAVARATALGILAGGSPER